MTHLVALGAFVVFVALGIGVAFMRHRARPAAHQQRAVTLLLVHVLAVGLVVAGSRRDLWPFSAWSLVVRPAPAAVGGTSENQSLRILAFDSMGVDHAVDYRAWQPLSVEELTAWLASGFARLDASQQQVVGRHLLDLANEGRRRARAGESFGVSDRIFGRLAAPTELLHPRSWSDRHAVPELPFVGVRIYREQFDLEALRAGGRIELALEYEFRGAR